MVFIRCFHYMNNIYLVIQLRNKEILLLYREVLYSTIEYYLRYLQIDMQSLIRNENGKWNTSIKLSLNDHIRPLINKIER